MYFNYLFVGIQILKLKKQKNSWLKCNKLKNGCLTADLVGEFNICLNNLTEW